MGRYYVVRVLLHDYLGTFIRTHKVPAPPPKHIVAEVDGALCGFVHVVDASYRMIMRLLEPLPPEPPTPASPDAT
ncbi:MAG: hypothetical protein GTO63_21290 [Anaerolineae bacterium]|nr:hypothetical protein [Anaerolineae bacterium]NIN97327.1 hypothetical protein [Anaerolineae bacterium]NIQ80248.1 hypothetical protein [Anaerolineae bacterium]